MYRRITVKGLICVLLLASWSGAALAGEGDVVAIIKLKGAMTEAPDALGLGPLFGIEAPPTMYDTLKKLREARKDAKLRAVVLDVEEAQLGLAQIQELRAQCAALKAADKDVLVFCETLSNGSLLLGSAASELVLLPTGEVVFNGMYGEGMYFKNLLDKIGVQADIIHCGSHKAAGEPFYRTGPSPEADAQNNWLMDSVFEQLIEGVAESRGLPPAKVRELIDQGWFSAKEALEAKLVDKLQYREDFIASIKTRYGKGTKVVSKYGEKAGPDIDFANPFAIFKVFGEMMKSPEKTGKPAIAVVYVEGAITTGKSEPSMFGGSSNAGSATIRRAIAEAAADDAVKALILRVDSPGGSAIASEVIAEATKRFKASGRPFIVSMGNVAASGGYYVSTLADTIYAEPGTITGSIGVVGGKLVTKGLWDWVGVTTHEYKRGRFADVMNTNRPFNEDERKLIEGMMNRVYAEFKGRVLEGRGGRIKGDLEPLAGGRVYTGKQALDIGLVDELGGFADAIKAAAKKAKLGTDYELRVFPRPKSLIELLADAFGSKKEDNEFSAASALTAGRLATLVANSPELGFALRAMASIDPAKAKAVARFLSQVESLSQEGVILVAPPLHLQFTR